MHHQPPCPHPQVLHGAALGFVRKHSAHKCTNVQAFWRAAVTALQLDQGQQEQLLYVGSMFMLFMADTDKLRKEISEHVLTVLPQSCGNRRYASIIQIAETMITVQQCATLLSCCLACHVPVGALRHRRRGSRRLAYRRACRKFTRADQEAVTFSSITFSEILTPLQFARFTTQAYPLFPNPCASASQRACTRVPLSMPPVPSACNVRSSGKVAAPQWHMRSKPAACRLQIIKVLAAEMSEQDRERLASATHGIDVAAIYDFAEHMCKCVAA